jgi:hypothetical protein
VASFFYAFNLYYTILLHTGLGIFDNVFLFYSFLPLLFYTVHRYFQEDKIIKSRFIIFYTLIGFLCFSAIPWFYSFLLFLLLLLCLNSILNNPLLYKTIIKKSLILIVISLLANSFFIIPLVYEYLDSSKLNSVVASYSSFQRGGFINQIRFFNWWTFTAKWSGRFFHSFYPFYNKVSIIFLLFVFYLILFKNNLFDKIEGDKKKFSLIFFSLFLLFLFLAKGSQAPFGEVFNWLFNYFPFFSLLRNPDNKLGSIIIFILSVMVLITLLKNKRFYHALVGFFVGFIIIYNIPLFIGDALVEKNEGLMFDNLVSISNDYNNIHAILNYKKVDFSILNIPGIRTSSYKIDGESGDGHSGQDLLRRIINKPLIYLRKLSSNSAESYEVIKNSENNLNVSKVLNLKYLMLRWDIPELIREKNSESGEISLLELSENIKNSNRYSQITDKDHGVLDIYKINNNSFLPHLYIPQFIITTSQNFSKLLDIVSMETYNIRSAIYFNKKNVMVAGEEEAFDPSKLRREIVVTPIIEFKKINPVKYRVVVHGASKSFPLVFSDSFHDGWRSYLVNYQKNYLNFHAVDYKILDGNEDDQASNKEFDDFINSGYISSFGDLKEKNIEHVKWENNKEVLDYNEKYKIDFISKNFQGTIQNDNLDSGSFYETWFTKPIDDNKNHFMVNGYANSWIIDPDKACFNSSKCIKNSDGSYDMELVVEFWPQRLMYVGLFISSITLIGCLGYLGFDLIRRRNRKHIKQIGKVINKKNKIDEVIK